MAITKKTRNEEPRLPELRKVVLLKVNGVHTPVATDAKTGGIKSKIRREISLGLLEPLKDSQGCRLKAKVDVDGTWKFEDVEEPLITFQGEYQAQFVFPVGVSIEQASTWLDNDFFGQAAIAQAMPVINMHMFAQLEMMGLSTRGRVIGHQPFSTSQSDAKREPGVKSISKVKAKTISKKT